MTKRKEFSVLKWFAFPGVVALWTGSAVLKQAERIAGADLAVLAIFAALAVISSFVACWMMGQERKVLLAGFVWQIGLVVGTLIAFAVTFYPK